MFKLSPLVAAALPALAAFSALLVAGGILTPDQASAAVKAVQDVASAFDGLMVPAAILFTIGSSVVSWFLHKFALKADPAAVASASAATVKAGTLATILAICVTGAMLSGCNQTTASKLNTAGALVLDAASSVSPGVAKASATASGKVAAASAKIATYCPQIQLVLGVSSIFVSGQAQQALQAASSASAKFCMAPPTDVVSAAVDIEQIFFSLQNAGLIKQ